MTLWTKAKKPGNGLWATHPRISMAFETPLFQPETLYIKDSNYRGSHSDGALATKSFSIL